MTRSCLRLVLVLAFSIAAQSAAASEPWTRIHLNLADRAEVAELSRLVSIERVDGLEVWAWVAPKRMTTLAEAGYEWQAAPEDREGRQASMCPSGWDVDPMRQWDCYPTYAQYVGLMQSLAANHPSICRLHDIGDSANQVRPHDLLVIEITDNPGVAEDEPEVFYTSTMHGDETTGYVLTLRLAAELVNGYGTDPELTAMVDGLEIWINPLANPDGTYYGSDSSVTSAIRNFVEADGSGWGPDPNRNFLDPDDGPHPDGEPYWPETVAMMDFADSSSFVLSANFHGGIEVVNYPWDTWSRLHVDDAWLVDISRSYASQVQADSSAAPYFDHDYMTDLNNGITNGYAWYHVAGGRQDYMTYYQGCREVTIELSTTKLLDSVDLPAYYAYNRQALIDYLEQAFEGLQGVVSSSDGGPLTATIEVVGLDNAADNSYVYTDPEMGDYHRMLLPGTYTVRFTAYGHDPLEVAGVVVASGPATRLDAILQALPSRTVTGRVTTPAAESAVAGATVEILGTPLDPVVTAGNGSYVVDSVIDGTYTFRVSAAGYATLEVQRLVSAPSTIHDFVLAPWDTSFDTDLEADDGGLVASGSPSPGWEWGVPGGASPPPHSGSMVWATDLDGEYANNGHWYLDLAGVAVPAANPRISFWHWYEIEQGSNDYDGGNISVSTNGGSTYQVIHPDGGYPSNNVAALYEPGLPQPGYTGSTGQWTQASFDLSAYAGQTVTVRWHFATDGSQTYRGWYVDDIAVAGVTYSADFEFAPTIPDVGQAVQFADRSSGEVLSWSWDFGDGGGSTAQNPSHAFTTAGLHQVTLDVTWASGADTRTRSIEVGTANLIFTDGFESGDTSAW